MRSLLGELESRFRQATAKAFGQAFADRNPQIRPAQDEQFGDYQCNAAMGLAKELNQKPREIAQRLIDQLDVSDLCETPEIAGPGFINLRLTRDWASRTLSSILTDDRLGLAKTDQPTRVVIDYSGPNIAKEMHVGHLRSTIIGDVIARVLEFLGDDVIRQNHIGDWGTQFGMLIAHLFETVDPSRIDQGEFEIADLEAFYREAQCRYQNDEAFASRARARVVALQGGDPTALRAWRSLRNESIRHCQRIYDQLGVSLTLDDIRGESDYNDRLPQIVSELLDDKQLAVKDQGAVCVFLDGFKTKEGAPLPVIIQKTDGGFLYATTDLAALKFRVQELKAQRIIYVTDARQALHFQQIFALARRAGWDIHPQTFQPVQLEHITFGSVLGENGKPLKTRSGESVKLAELLDEAIERARAVVDEKNPDLSDERRRQIAHVVGIGAVKYADLSQNRTSDYIFSFEKMLAMDGNTAPYMMYAYARIKSIERRGEIETGTLPPEARIILAEPAELKLGKKILQFADALDDVSTSLRPNIITAYLYDLSQAFSVFYENCPVLKAASDELRISRLWLCDLTARTLKLGLDLLGIKTLEQM